jgi:predicted acyl esterase
MRVADDRRFDTSPSTSEQVHSGKQQGKARDVHGADRRAVGQPGDDGGKNESAGINRIENREGTAALKRRHEKHHHPNVADYSRQKARVENVTRERVPCLFCAGFVIELPERAEKSGDDKQDNGERRGSHRLE